MTIILDNDLHGLARPRAASEWTFQEQTLAGVQFWDAVAHEVDNALLRAVGPERWTAYVEQVFRAQQSAYFPAGADLLGIPGDASDATRCALYHCLSTGLAGSRSRYAIESETKAWIFYQPNIMSVASPAYRRELQLAAYRGWYVHNGPSLGNDRMVFVVTHLVADGDPYDAGYFEDTGRPVPPEDRLRFAHGSTPPPPQDRRLPELDESVWPEERRLRALRNLVSGWAWDHISAAPLLLGDEGTTAIGRAVALTVGSFRPYFDAALAESGARSWAAYFALVHRAAGFPVTVRNSGDLIQVTLERDPVVTSTLAPRAATAAATHRAVHAAWAVACAEDGVAVTPLARGGLAFGPAAP